MTHSEAFSQTGRAGAHPAASTSFLAGGGEMGERIRAFDWSSTPLGPVERWPQSLKTVVRIMLTSRQPIWIGWGPELIKLYNDPYKTIAGGKHPDALGQPAERVWREIWDQVGPRLRTAVETNEGTYDESLLLIMERNGYPEETYYTFSYSPVPGDEDGIGGIICANTDDTQRIIGERQVKLLRTLAAETADARTIEAACQMSATSLEHNPYDITFAALYLFDQEHQVMTLVGTSGLEQDQQIFPATASLDTSSFWPFAEVLREQQTRPIAEINQTFTALPSGVWKRPSHQAVAIPIAPSGQEGKAGVLLVGLNPFRLFDESYQGFLSLVAGHIAASLANAQAYEEERKRAEALAELDRAKTLFFSNVSHEFRTPLTLMLGPIEDTLAEARTLSPEQRERTELLHHNALRLLRLVNALLDFSRIEAGRVEVAYTATDLATLTADLASSFRSVIERAGMTLHVDCPPLSEPVYVDQQMWEKIVLNLLSNAFKYTLQGSISVRLRLVEEMVELTVTDTGVGIPAEELPHMFERFHRVRGSRGRTIEGTGIGLSLVQELVHLHGGTISVTSTEGRGSTFTVALPRGTAHLPADRLNTQHNLSSTAIDAHVYVDEALRLLENQDASAEMLAEIQTSDDDRHSPSATGQAGARILFADDNADMRSYVSRLLRSRYDVLVVPHGQAALDALPAYQPDLVLTDVMMPELDGFGLLQAIRSDPRTSTIPVILLSARAGEEATVEGMEAGADDYLTKPFGARELLARVGAHLEIARLRKEAEERVKVERQRLYTLFLQAPAAVAVLRGPTHIVELANPNILKFWGRSREQALNQPLFDLLPELHGQGLEALLDGVFSTGIPYIGQELKVALDSDGDGKLEDTYYTFVYSPLRSPAGMVEGVMIFTYDVTEQVLSRQKAEESEKRFRLLAENISQFAWMAEPTGAVFWYNQRWYDYTGADPQDIGKRGSRYVHPEHFERVSKRFRACISSGEVWEDTFPLRRHDGAYRWFLSRAIPVHDEQGRIMRWFGTNTDITERLELEEQKEEFLGIASHELKTPVTSLKGYTQLLQRHLRQVGDERASMLISRMNTQITKLTALINDLLDVTRIESGHLLFHQTEFAWNALVEENIEEVRQTTQKQTILFRAGPEATLTGDRERLGQVLANLLTNAIKYGPEADTILVTTSQTEHEMLTSVQDFGIGIPPQQQAHIFERFFRVQADTQGAYSGLGLGLYISAEFVKRHQGRIWVESEPGKGTTMTFALPLKQRDHTHGGSEREIS